MKDTVFVDAFAWIASINKNDNYHEISLSILENLIKEKTKLITTNYVLIETINALSNTGFRKSVIEFINKIENSQSVSIVKITDEIYNNAWNIYKKRLDKDWRITDCTSFEVMHRFKINKAFTNDNHFEQAGYYLMVK